MDLFSALKKINKEVLLGADFAEQDRLEGAVKDFCDRRDVEAKEFLVCLSSATFVKAIFVSPENGQKKAVATLTKNKIDRDKAEKYCAMVSCVIRGVDYANVTKIATVEKAEIIMPQTITKDGGADTTEQIIDYQVAKAFESASASACEKALKGVQNTYREESYVAYRIAEVYYACDNRLFTNSIKYNRCKNLLLPILEKLPEKQLSKALSKVYDSYIFLNQNLKANEWLESVAYAYRNSEFIKSKFEPAHLRRLENIERANSVGRQNTPPEKVRLVEVAPTPNLGQKTGVLPPQNRPTKTVVLPSQNVVKNGAKSSVKSSEVVSPTVANSPQNSEPANTVIVGSKVAKDRENGGTETAMAASQTAKIISLDNVDEPVTVAKTTEKPRTFDGMFFFLSMIFAFTFLFVVSIISQYQLMDFFLNALDKRYYILASIIWAVVSYLLWAICYAFAKSMIVYAKSKLGAVFAFTLFSVAFLTFYYLILAYFISLGYPNLLLSSVIFNPITIMIYVVALSSLIKFIYSLIASNRNRYFGLMLIFTILAILINLTLYFFYSQLWTIAMCNGIFAMALLVMLFDRKSLSVAMHTSQSKVVACIVVVGVVVASVALGLFL